MTRILVPYHLDEYLPDLDLPAAADTVVTVDLPAGDTWQRISRLYDPVATLVAAAVQRDERPIVLSGDCTTSFGTVAGLQRAGLDPAIVWFDAHGDLQTLETTATGYLGGMPLRMILGYRPDLVADRIGLRPLAEEQVLLVDARDLDPPEATYLSTAAIRRCGVEELSAELPPAHLLPDGPIYLHVDFDVVDPGDLPGLVFPAPGGPGLSAVADAVRRVVATGRVAAFGGACTWHPGHGAGDRVRPLVQATLRTP